MGPEDAKFLLVHHTASSNQVPDPREVIRQTYAFHTGPSKRWPDICYLFMIGPDGSIWDELGEPRASPRWRRRSRNKLRAGTSITTPRISGHRDVTYTACPGNVGYTLLDGWRRRVHATRLVRDEPGPLRSATRLDVHLS